MSAGSNQMKPMRLETTDTVGPPGKPARPGLLCHDNRFHLMQQGLIERDGIDSVIDAFGTFGQSNVPDGIELHEQRITDIAFIDKREQIGVRRKAAIPVVVAIDLNGMVDRRQAGRCQNRIDGQLRPPKQSRAPRLDVRCGYQQPNRRRIANSFKIDVVLEDFA